MVHPKISFFDIVTLTLSNFSFLKERFVAFCSVFLLFFTFLPDSGLLQNRAGGAAAFIWKVIRSDAEPEEVFAFFCDFLDMDGLAKP